MGGQTWTIMCCFMHHKHILFLYTHTLSTMCRSHDDDAWQACELLRHTCVDNQTLFMHDKHILFLYIYVWTIRRCLCMTSISCFCTYMCGQSGAVYAWQAYPVFVHSYPVNHVSTSWQWCVDNQALFMHDKHILFSYIYVWAIRRCLCMTSISCFCTLIPWQPCVDLMTVMRGQSGAVYACQAYPVFVHSYPGNHVSTSWQWCVTSMQAFATYMRGQSCAVYAWHAYPSFVHSYPDNHVSISWQWWVTSMQAFSTYMRGQSCAVYAWQAYPVFVHSYPDKHVTNSWQWCVTSISAFGHVCVSYKCHTCVTVGDTDAF
jgi:hypothetical protein